MSLFDKIKNTLTEQSNSGSGKKVKFGSGAKGEFASGSPSMGGEDKTYVKQGKKPLKGKNVKPGQTTGTSQPKRGATTIRQTGQTNLFTGKVEKPQQVKVKTTYQKKTTKPIRVNPDQGKLNFDSPRQIVKNLDKRDAQIKKLDQQIIKPKSGDAQRTDKFIKRKQKSYDIQSKSALKKAKKYAAGGYPKIGGGGLKPDIKPPVKGSTPVKTNVSKLNVDKIFSDKTKTKSSSTVVPKNITAKSKGTTPVRVNISKPVKQSEVSKKAKEFTTKINRANVNRKEFKFDPKTKERQTFRGKITSGPRKGEGYTIFRRDGGDVKKGVDKGVIPKAAKGDPIDVKSPAHRDLFKRYNKGQPKATQFMIDLAKDDRKARGLGKRAERIKGATGGKKTGSLKKGNLSFPGDRTGAYSATKSQIDFDKALKKARGNTEGDLPKETPQSVRDYAKKVRGERIKKYGLPDTSFGAKDKFSQKEFEKGLKSAKKSTKKFVTPSDPFKGATGVASPSAATKLKFQPRDVSAKTAEKKAVKSFTQFNKDLKKAGANIEIEKKVINPSYRIGSRSSAPGGGGRPPRKINKKYKQGNLFDPPSGGSSSGGGGGKPPKPPKNNTLGFPEPPKGGSSGGSGGVDPDGVFKGKIPKKTDKKTRKLLKTQNKRLKKIQKLLQNTKGGAEGVGKKQTARTGKDAMNLLRRIKAKRTPTIGKVLKGTAKLAVKNPVLALAGAAGIYYGGKAIVDRVTRKGPTALSKSTFAGSLKYGKGYGKHAGKSVEVTNNRNNKDMNKLAKGITTKNYNTPKMQKTIDSRIKSGEYNMVNRKGQILKYPSKTK